MFQRRSKHILWIFRVSWYRIVNQLFNPSVTGFCKTGFFFAMTNKMFARLLVFLPSKYNQTTNVKSDGGYPLTDHGSDIVSRDQLLPFFNNFIFQILAFRSNYNHPVKSVKLQSNEKKLKGFLHYKFNMIFT